MSKITIIYALTASVALSSAAWTTAASADDKFNDKPYTEKWAPVNEARTTWRVPLTGPRRPWF